MEIIECTQKLHDEDELSISFIQIGEEPGAHQYLKTLDKELEATGAKFDIGEFFLILTCITFVSGHKNV